MSPIDDNVMVMATKVIITNLIERHQVSFCEHPKTVEVKMDVTHIDNKINVSQIEVSIITTEGALQ